MKHTPDLASKPPSVAAESADETLANGARRLAEALPFPLLVRHDNGRVAFLNSAARSELGIPSDDVSEMALTLILRGTEDGRASNVYLLSVEREAMVRLVATTSPIDLGLDRALEVLVIEPARPGPDSSSPRRSPMERSPHPRRPEPAARPRLRRKTRPSAGVVFHPRQLLACAARRLMRQFEGDVELTIAAAPTKRCDRRARLDEIAFAEVLLNSAEWIFSRAARRSLSLSACLSGHRLRVSLEGPPRIESESLETEHDWLRAVRPFVDAHRATFEIHDDAERLGIVISLPILR